jgi:hypothetical protein
VFATLFVAGVTGIVRNRHPKTMAVAGVCLPARTMLANRRETSMHGTLRAASVVGIYRVRRAVATTSLAVTPRVPRIRCCTARSPRADGKSPYRRWALEPALSTDELRPHYQAPAYTQAGTAMW